MQVIEFVRALPRKKRTVLEKPPCLYALGGRKRFLVNLQRSRMVPMNKTELVSGRPALP